MCPTRRSIIEGMGEVASAAEIALPLFPSVVLFLCGAEASTFFPWDVPCCRCNSLSFSLGVCVIGGVPEARIGVVSAAAGLEALSPFFFGASDCRLRFGALSKSNDTKEKADDTDTDSAAARTFGCD